MQNPAARLVEIFGGRAEVAARFDCTREAVRLWLEHGIPTDRALEVEEATRRSKEPIAAIDVLRYARQQKKAA